MTTTRLEPKSGFQQVSSASNTSLAVYIAKPDLTNEYEIEEPVKVTGLCSYRFLTSTGIVRGVAFKSPMSSTHVTPVMVKIGACSGQFTLNTDLQHLGVLLYASDDDSVLIIPVDVASPLLVEVDS